MPADELAARHEEMKSELTRLESMEDRLRRAEADYKEKLKAYRAEAALLTQARQTLAARFESLMETQLRDLGMQNTRFACVFEPPGAREKAGAYFQRGRPCVLLYRAQPRRAAQPAG